MNLPLRVMIQQATANNALLEEQAKARQTKLDNNNKAYAARVAKGKYTKRVNKKRGVYSEEDSIS